MTTRYAHLSQAHLQEAVTLLEGGSEEAGGYTTIRLQKPWRQGLEGSNLLERLVAPTGLEPVFRP